MSETFAPTPALLDGVTAAAHEAGKLILDTPMPTPPRSLDEFRAAFDVVQGPAERLLRTRLDSLLPGVPWAEEFGTVLPVGEQRWVADVIDGAIQYIQGLPQWCVSVTLIHDREAVATVLHNPIQGEVYRAATGLGAFRDHRSVSPSAKTDLSTALVATSHPPFAATQPIAVAEAGRSLSAVVPEVGAVRNLGPTSWQIADVASGRLDAFWEYGVDDTNHLGAVLIAREAGATVTDADGKPWLPNAHSLLAAPPALHAPLLALLQNH